MAVGAGWGYGHSGDSDQGLDICLNTLANTRSYPVKSVDVIGNLLLTLLGPQIGPVLRDLRSTAISSSCSGPGPLLPGDLRPLPGLRDAACAFPFAGSTTNKAEHVLQTWLVTLTATDKVWPSTALYI